MKSIFTKGFWQIDSLRTTWEYKIIALILRGMVALLVIMYLLVALPAAYQWLQASSVRMQPIEAFASVLDQSIASDDFTAVQRWVSFRARADRPALAAVLESRVEDIPGPLIAVLVDARRMEGDRDTTLFWLMMARYRLRFDVLRCGQPDLVAAVRQSQVIAASIPHLRNELSDIDSQPAIALRLLQEVLSYDGKHPARNSPAFTCQLLQGLSTTSPEIAPADTWATTRHTLRLVTERAIEDMSKKKAR